MERSLFNSWNKAILHFLWTMTPMPFDAFFGLRPKVDSVLYHWNTVRWLLWISVGVGAPIAFSAWAWHHERLLKHKYEEILNAKLDEKSRAFAEASARAKERIRELEAEIRYRDDGAKQLNAEVEKWKALANFNRKASSGDEPTNAESESQKGVLDSDAL